MHPYFKCFFFAFFFISVSVHYFPSSLSQLFSRGLMFSALYALIFFLIFFFLNICLPTPPSPLLLLSGLSSKWISFFFSSVYRDYSISSIWDVSKWKTNFQMYSTGTWGHYCNNAVPAWRGVSLVVILACWALLCCCCFFGSLYCTFFISYLISLFLFMQIIFFASLLQRHLHQVG